MCIRDSLVRVVVLELLVLERDGIVLVGQLPEDLALPLARVALGLLPVRQLLDRVEGLPERIDAPAHDLRGIGVDH
eukprot:6235254-Alexandrium_andersonii.AAC.1